MGPQRMSVKKASVFVALTGACVFPSCCLCRCYSRVVFWSVQSVREGLTLALTLIPGLIWEPCVCECVTTSHGLLIHKASPRPLRSSRTQAHATTLTHTQPTPFHPHEQTPPTHLVHTYKPSIPCHTHMHPRSPPCLFSRPPRPLCSDSAGCTAVSL